MLTPDASANAEDLIARFEALARAGRAPEIERLLADTACPLDRAARNALVVELVAIDLEYRWQSPHRRGPLLELYVKRLGQWASLDDVPLELVAEEYRARQRFGDRPAHAEYAARFPRHGQALLDELRRVDAELVREYPAAQARASPEAEAVVAAVPPVPLVSRDPSAPLDYRDYAIRRLIAAGGMSRVYTALQKSLHKPVAIKVLNKSLARNPQSVKRFLREARIAAELEMLGAVNAFGLGRFPDGGYFMVLRLVDGPDLTRLPAALPLPDTRALTIVRQVAAVVAALHERGWLHCDLKPSNILVDSRGGPWLTDFAMAQPWNSSAALRGDDDRFALGGTPAFMAPEQFAGDAALLTPATDIFAIGGILFYLLTGRPPRGEGNGFRIESTDVRWDFLDGVDPALQRVARRCLAEASRQRYRSCTELLADLGGRSTTSDGE